MNRNNEETIEKERTISTDLPESSKPVQRPKTPDTGVKTTKKFVKAFRYSWH